VGKIADSVLIGADPEIGLLDAEDSPVPAWTITDGTKENHQLIRKSIGLSVHADGVALEFNFKPSSTAGFSDRAINAWKHISNFVTSSKLRIYRGSEIEEGFSAEHLMHPLAQMEGCDPDFSAYAVDPSKNRGNKPKGLMKKQDTKCFGGHIHIGYPKSLIPDWAMIRMMDALYYVGNMGKDPQGERRKWYGQAGVFRPKPYGVEYRTPSNFWCFRPIEPLEISTTVRRIVSGIEERPLDANVWFNSVDWADVQECINEYDSARGRILAAKYWEGFNEAVGQRV
jgi:hypothetical protein